MEIILIVKILIDVIRNAITIINNCIKNDNNIYYKTHVVKKVYLLGQIYVV